MSSQSQPPSTPAPSDPSQPFSSRLQPLAPDAPVPPKLDERHRSLHHLMEEPATPLNLSQQRQTVGYEDTPSLATEGDYRDSPFSHGEETVKMDASPAGDRGRAATHDSQRMFLSGHNDDESVDIKEELRVEDKEGNGKEGVHGEEDMDRERVDDEDKAERDGMRRERGLSKRIYENEKRKLQRDKDNRDADSADAAMAAARKFYRGTKAPEETSDRGDAPKGRERKARKTDRIAFLKATGRM